MATKRCTSKRTGKKVSCARQRAGKKAAASRRRGRRAGGKWPTMDEVAKLVEAVKDNIDSDTYVNDEDADEGGPNGILLTVGADGKGGWSYQTGDTSFMGGAYGYPYWGSAGVYRNSHPRAVAREIIEEVKEQAAW